MVPTSQPHVLAAWIGAFAAFDEAHGFAVNLFAVMVLAVIGAVLVSGRPRLIRPAVIAFAVLCQADWVLIEDIGLAGGLGTDPNSMIPMALLATARIPGPDPGSRSGGRASQRSHARRELGGPAPRRGPPRSLASAGIRSVASLWAVGLIILGAVPMAAAQASPVADTIVARAIDGSSAPVNYRAPPFSLTDQHGCEVTLASLWGKVVLSAITVISPAVPSTAAVPCAATAATPAATGTIIETVGATEA